MLGQFLRLFEDEEVGILLEIENEEGDIESSFHWLSDIRDLWYHKEKFKYDDYEIKSISFMGNVEYNYDITITIKKY